MAKNTKDSRSQAVQFVMKRFDSSWTYAQTNYHKRWERNWKLYNNQHVDRGYIGKVSNVFVPITFSTIETLVSAMSGSTDWDFEPPKGSPQKTDALNALVDSYAVADHWPVKDEDFTRRYLREGTAVEYVCWENNRPLRMSIPIRDFFINPEYASMETDDPTFYCGRRYLTTKEALKQYQVIDPETQEMKPKFKNLDKVKEGNISSPGGEQTDKEIKDMFYGSTVTNPEQNQVEVIELWTVDKVYSIANRSVCIEEAENPHKARHRLVLARKLVSQQIEAAGVDPTMVPPELMQGLEAEAAEQAKAEARGIIPFFYQRDFADESLFYGTSIIDVIASRQEQLNDLTNQIGDYLAFTVLPEFTIDPTNADYIDQIQFAPGAIHPFALEPIVKPQLPSEVFVELNNIKNDIRETTGVSEVVKGAGADAKATATEIRAQTAQAGARITRKINRFEGEALDRLGRIIVSMIQIYVTNPIVLEEPGPVDPMTGMPESPGLIFDPAEFDGDYIPHATLVTELESKHREEMETYEKMYMALSQDPSINQTELKKMALPKMYGLDPEQVDKLTTPDPAMQAMVSPMADPGMAGALPTEELAL